MQVPPEVNPPMTELMFRCWDGNPRLRPDFASILLALTEFAGDKMEDGGGDVLVEAPSPLPSTRSKTNSAARAARAKAAAAAAAAARAQEKEEAASAVVAVTGSGDTTQSGSGSVAAGGDWTAGGGAEDGSSVATAVTPRSSRQGAGGGEREGVEAERGGGSRRVRWQDGWGGAGGPAKGVGRWGRSGRGSTEVDPNAGNSGWGGRFEGRGGRGSIPNPNEMAGPGAESFAGAPGQWRSGRGGRGRRGRGEERWGRGAGREGGWGRWMPSRGGGQRGGEEGQTGGHGAHTGRPSL